MSFAQELYWLVQKSQDLLRLSILVGSLSGFLGVSGVFGALAVSGALGVLGVVAVLGGAGGGGGAGSVPKVVPPDGWFISA